VDRFLKNIPSLKFFENPPSENGVVLYQLTDRRTDRQTWRR